MMTTTLSNSVNSLEDLACQNIELVLGELGIDYTVLPNKVVAPCPIHGGDNPTAFAIFTGGHTRCGNWACYTQGCHRNEGVNSTFIGLIQEIKDFNFWEAVEWLSKLLNVEVSLQTDPLYKTTKHFYYISTLFNFSRPQNKFKIRRDDIRKTLKLCPQYYIKRGYSSRILDIFDVGLCTNHNKELYNRIVVPIYDDNNEFLVGATARTTYPLCGYCNHYHPPTIYCPTDKFELKKYAKWIHSSGFKTTQYLYNYGRALRHIKQSRTVFLVEGPGDVWRLEEAGIYNCLALFGKNISETQIKLLEKSGAVKIMALLDSDAAGNEGKENLEEKLNYFFSISFPEISSNDVGDIKPKQLRLELAKYIGE